MLSQRKLRKFVRQWRRRYPLPLEWVDNRANKQCRRSEDQWLEQFRGATGLKKRDVVGLVEWRFQGRNEAAEQALEGLAGPAESGHARRCIRKALSTTSPTGALDHLLEERGGISGWGPPMASVVLGACRPDAYLVADARALRTLEALGLYSPDADDEFTRDDWWPYLRICRRLADRCDLPLRDVERALRAAADHAPKLPKAPKPSKASKV